MKIYSIKLIIITLLLILLFGCGQPLEAGLYTNLQIESILEEVGLELTGVALSPPVPLNTPVQPIAYNIAENEYLFVYQFNSIATRNEYFPMAIGSPPHFPYTDLSEMESMIFVFSVKNVAMIYYPVAYQDDTHRESILQTVTKLNRAVIYEMNEVKETVWQGQGDYWEVSFELEYFKNEWEDYDSVPQTEYYGILATNLEFTGADPDSVTDLRFSYSLRENESRERGIGGGKNPVLNEAGTFESNEHLYEPIEKETVTITIEWNGNQEEFELLKITEKTVNNQ